MPGVVIVAHAPLASSMLACATHVFGVVSYVLAYDVQADEPPEAIREGVLGCIRAADRGAGVLLLTDVMGATPANQACQAAQAARGAGIPAVVVAGVNVPMLLRALTNREQGLDELVQRVLAGGVQGVLRAETDFE